MTRTTTIFIAAFSLGAVALTGCQKDDDQPEVPQPVINEPEEINTVELHFTKEGSSDHFDVKWSDPDGPGGDDPVMDAITLDANSVYSVEVYFKDASGDSEEDVTPEIRDEDDEHLVCFEPHGSELENELSIVRTDSDGTYEVGLESQWTTGAASSGEVHVTLKHQTLGVKDGTCEPGDTDVEVDFEITIQ